MKYNLKIIACLIVLSVIYFKSYSQAPNLIVNSKVYYDANFNPKITITYRNVYKQNISQIMCAFVYNTYSGWDNTSLKRSLVEAATVRTVRNIEIAVGKTYKDDFVIPPLDGYDAKPVVHISKIRFSDGSIQTFD